MPADVGAKPVKGAHPRTEEFLKTWRQDALNKHQYDAAIFIGDKLHALTGDPKDAFWLAQVHFSTGHFNRAQTFLTRNDLVQRSTSCRYLAALCLIKQSKYEEALQVLGDKNPMHLISGSGGSSLGRRRGTRAGGKDRDDQGNNVKFEAAMCYLRGLVYAKQNAFDKAKDCYKCAVQVDVKCFEAFDQLMKNALMSPEEEWKFLESLDFDGLTAEGESGEEAEFVRMLYTTRLSKYKNPQIFSEASEQLANTYGLHDNADLVISRAELLFTQCKFKECLELCETVIGRDQYNFSVYPLYLACMHELNMKNKLFLISHDMADNFPEEPVTWLAVGVYYLTTHKISEARRFFSKASMMDPHFGPAWIGFAHTFAAEGEHDQAISAYSTAARLFQGTHLPQLFLGMQHLQLNNITLADEYLNTAYKLCTSDPLLLNELGVVFYHKEALHDAVGLFEAALRIATEIDSNPKAWLATKANLAHTYRRLENYDKALALYEEVVRGSEEKDAGVYSAMGLCQLQAERPWNAIVAFHTALAISPQDPIATDLLEKALKENSEKQDVFTTDDGTIGPENIDELIHQRQHRAHHPRAAIPRGHGRTNSGVRVGRRTRLGDVTREFGGMDVSDDDAL
ncbi:hypothetical protein EDC01DRAFT_694941 [Geopyxis carbonaria]|nr:hypothetical protein EDC01DRAFT_694941 [Geopyxis carbonaria]